MNLTLLTQPDCAGCEHAKQVLARLAGEYPLQVSEVDLRSPTGRDLATAHRLPFAPGLLLDGRLLGYGRISERALRRELNKITHR